MNLENSLHHEAHEDHEDFSWNCMMLSNDPEGEFHFMDNLLFLFVFIVLFVVQMRNLG